MDNHLHPLKRDGDAHIYTLKGDMAASQNSSKTVPKKSFNNSSKNSSKKQLQQQIQKQFQKSFQNSSNTVNKTATKIYPRQEKGWVIEL